jgi:hypothetical protein
MVCNEEWPEMEQLIRRETFLVRSKSPPRVGNGYLMVCKSYLHHSQSSLPQGSSVLSVPRGSHYRGLSDTLLFLNRSKTSSTEFKIRKMHSHTIEEVHWSCDHVHYTGREPGEKFNTSHLYMCLFFKTYALVTIPFFYTFHTI